MPTANDRIFYACQGVSIQKEGYRDSNVATGEMIHGLQSVGVTTNFNLEQAFELGQIEIYENIEGTPDVEVTLEKVLDGYPLIYHLASEGINNGTPPISSGLVNRSKQRCDVRLGIFPEENNFIKEGGGSADMEVYMSGMYISSISYSLNSDGSSTESVTLVGNNKQWYKNRSGKMLTGSVANFDGTDAPLGMGDATNPSGGVTQKEDVIISGCIFPASIEGVTGSGYGNGIGKIHAQSVSVSTDFSREDIFELGRKTPYARPAAYPIEVSCDIEVVTTSGDLVEAREDGDATLFGTIDSGNNTQNECIFFYTRNGLGLDLGEKNRLSSVSYGGGDAGGGNASCTYSYQNFNTLDVQNRRNGYIGFNALKETLLGTAKRKYSNDGNGMPFPDDIV
tara:strand:- start:6077 stop:7261 length:1185 start_codon:yes stop_codon:yes gene_type:complete